MAQQVLEIYKAELFRYTHIRRLNRNRSNLESVSFLTLETYSEIVFFKRQFQLNWVILNYFSSDSDDVPDECTSYNVFNEPGRYWSSTGHSMICDDNLASDHDGWYRFEGAAGIMMATHCIPIQSCNSHMAGWIGGGDHPSSAYQKVTRTAYMHYGSSCENVAYPETEIRNCSGFYVYKLQSVNGCYQRYCGVNGKCHIKNIRFFF